MTRARGWYWPWLLAVGMLGIVGVNVGMLFVARSDRNGTVVEPDYYRKAVAWDSTMARRAASDALGWTAQVALEAAGRDAAPTTITIQLADRAAAPVRGATVSATLIHNADAGHPIDVQLTERAPGTYVSVAALSHPGLWEVRVAAQRGAEVFDHIAHIDRLVPAP